jgi:hypothetical protein
MRMMPVESAWFGRLERQQPLLFHLHHNGFARTRHLARLTESLIPSLLLLIVRTEGLLSPLLSTIIFQTCSSCLPRNVLLP